MFQTLVETFDEVGAGEKVRPQWRGSQFRLKQRFRHTDIIEEIGWFVWFSEKVRLRAYQVKDVANDANSLFGSGPRYLNCPTTFAPFPSIAFAIWVNVDPAANL